jgi:hypothetical protein
MRLLIDRCRLAALAFMGLRDSPRWLRERDEMRDEVDGYRHAAALIVGEFVGPEATARKIHERMRGLEEEVFRLRSEAKRVL